MANSLEGKRILLVEDDELVAMTVEDILLYAKAALVTPARSVGEALDALAGDAFDVAIVDVNLDGEASWPVAAELRRRGIRYLTVTGYGDLCDHELVGSLLPKPYSMDALIDAVSGLLVADDHTTSTPGPGTPA